MGLGNNNLTKDDLTRYFNELGKRLHEKGVISEIAIYGGSALALQYSFRESTQDIDYLPISQDTALLRQEADALGDEANLSDDWFNTAIEDVADNGHYSFYGDFPQDQVGLRVFVAEPKYILSMKMLSMRSALDSNDPFDVWNLMKDADINTIEEAKELIAEFYPGKTLSRRNELIIDDMLEALKSNDDYNKMLGM